MKKLIKRPKIILIPYPAQGHVNPMVKLAFILLNSGFEPVIITPQFIHRRIISTMDPTANILCISIPDELPNEKQVSRDFFAIEKTLENTFPAHLETFLRKFCEDGEVSCMIVDLLASSAIDVGRRCGVPVAGFWPAMLATYHLILAIPDMITTGLISDSGNPQHEGPISILPNQPSISTKDLPWLIGTQSARKSRFKFWRRTLDRSANLPWILTNSFQEHSSTNKHTLLFQLGSLINTKNTITKNPSFWEEDNTSIHWLNKQKTNSVLYISFGSWVSPIGEAKVRALALTLEAMKQPFIWVLAPAWREGLPLKFIESVRNQGKLVSWAPQMEILKHHAVGCYLTHCGWNSTLEAVQCRKPLLCYPVAGDQFVNCGYIVEKWKIGVKINGFAEKEIQESFKKVRDDKDMDKRLMRLYDKMMGEEATLRAMSNLNTFLHHLNNLQNQCLGYGL
ncbi:UDP-glycosyltransferase 82A1 [Euphorbia lathyris]|uniref:UDP-glycosyltransferase 82A1 n=1 Tax=Euphorbia lathyris TaxID=212925 RepID=UPI0033139C60